MREALVVLVLAAAAIGGCITNAPGATVDPASTVRGVTDLVHDLGEVLEARVPVAGAALHGTVYLPDVDEGVKVPVILDLGPYYGNLGPETSAYSEKHPPSLLYEHFLRRGYAIALVSVRGTGQSGGCFMIGGAEERADAAAVVEWLASQEWSSGAVAMTGVSYDGTTPWEALVSGQAPSLKAIIPVEGISDFYRYSFFEGVPVGGGAAFNTYYKVLVDHAYTNPQGVPPWLAVQPANLCPQQADVYLSPYHTYRDGVHGPYWDERDMGAMLEGASAPVFVVHGLKDFNVKMDHAQTLWGKLPPGSRMLFGQWAHNIPWRNSYDENQSWHEYNATMDSFLDAHLRGDAAALAEQEAAPRVLVQDSANVTRGFSQWPPAEARDAAWRLAPGGGLATAPAEEGAATLRSSPLKQLALAAGQGRRLPENELAFASEPLAEDALLVGNPWLDLVVTVDRPEGHLAAKLYEVNGTKRELVSMGWQNLATRESRDKASDVPTGQPLQVRLLMEAVAQRVEAGNSLLLVLQAENDHTTTPKVQATTFTFALGGDDGAALWLPTLAE